MTGISLKNSQARLDNEVAPRSQDIIGILVSHDSPALYIVGCAAVPAGQIHERYTSQKTTFTHFFRLFRVDSNY